MKIIIMIAAGCGSIMAYAADSVSNADYGSLNLQQHSSFSRLLVTLDDSFKPMLKNGPKGFEIHVPSAGLLDIGIPMEGDIGFNRHLSKLGDERISKLEVSEQGDELIIKGKYIFPSGKDAFAKPEMEHFDFYQKDSGKFVVDFWYKKGLTVAEAAKQRKLDLIRKTSQARNEVLKKEAQLKMTREKRIEESRGDLRFCDAPISKENTLWVKYRAEHPVLNFNHYFPEFIPDHNFHYQEPAGMEEEKQMVRLALKLSRENKHALVIKTVDFLRKSYPKSKYIEEMEFLKASSFYRLELYDQGKMLLMELAKLSKGTDVGVSATSFLGMQSFRRQEWLSSLDSFMSILKDNPKHTYAWLFHYGSAESLYQIKQYDQARVEYEWLMKNEVSQQVRNEVGYKLGDMYFNRNQYAQAIQAYTSVISKNAEGLSRYPQVFMNLGEAFFQLDEYEKAEENFSRYLEFARAFPTAWKASLRLAEIRSMKMPKNFEKNFTETVNQYPMTPGAAIARLRMLPCGSHGGFDLASATRYVGSDEVKKIEDPAAFYSTSLTELIALTEVRTLLSFSQDEKAVERGVAGLRENPSLEARRMIERALVGGVKRLLEKQIAENDFYEAIAIYEKYGDYLPGAGYDPVCDDIRLKIAQFAAEKNLISLALKLIEPYRNGDEIGLKNAANEIQKNLKLDSTTSMESRLFVEAKSIWNGEKFDSKDEKQSARFLEKISGIRDVSPLSFDRDLLKTLFLTETGKYGEAIEIAKTLGEKMSKIGHYSRAQTWYFLGEVAVKAKDAVFAAKAYREARVVAARLTEKDKPDFEYRHFPAVPSLSRLYAAEGEQLELQEKWKDSVALYQQAIENKIGGNHLLYSHARALLKEGGRESKLTASRSLEKIKQSQEDDVWKNLAQKALDTIAKEGNENENRK